MPGTKLYPVIVAEDIDEMYNIIINSPMFYKLN